MFKDLIVEETRQIREQIASEHDYDVYKLGNYFIKKQKDNQRIFINIPNMPSPSVERIQGQDC